MLKKPSALFVHTLFVGITAVTVGFSASHLRAKTHKKAPNKISKKQDQKQQRQQDQADAPTYKTLAESLGTPAPVLKADGRYPQSVTAADTTAPARKVVSKKVIKSKKKTATGAITEAEETSAPLAQKDAITVSQSNIAVISAQSTAQAQSTGLDTKKNQKAGAAMATTYTTSVLENSANTRSASMDFEIVPWVRISKKLRMDMFMGFSKDLKNDQKFTLSPWNIAVFNDPIALNRTVKYRAKMHILLPTDQEARNIGSFRSGVTLANRFYVNPKGLPNLNSYYQLSATKNIHQYQTSGLGESNQSISVANSIYLEYNISNFYVSVAPRLTQRWTYERTPSSRYDMAEEIGVNIQDSASVAIGHSNLADLYKANGRDSNFSLYDQDTSTYYLTASFTF